jgi:lipoprotein-anchoring transpeptidase ErfK/SrfK
MGTPWWIAPIAATYLVASGTAANARELTPGSINKAAFPSQKGKGIEPGIIKAQVLLDRLRFSPGVIDGTGGENLRKAFTAFEHSQQLTESGQLDRPTWEKLNAVSEEPIIVDYTISDADVRGPFVKRIPQKMEDMAKLKALDYTSPVELLSEKFHIDERLLKALNPGKNLYRAGETILVTNVERPGEKGLAAKVEVDKKVKMVRAFDKGGALLASFPASIGSNEKPAPSGSFKVRAVKENPTYHYSPNFKFKGVKAKKSFTIPPGPNNPVGSVWIDLSLPSYGIHGTPEPSKVSKTYSHGCIRLTNWDAKDLAKLIAKGAPVEFID